MRSILITAFFMAGIFSSCSSQNVTVNGETIELEDGIYAMIKTNKGDILFRFETEKAPLTSANFIALAEGNMPEVDDKYKDKPYFDGLSFHRVIPNFMIQGGDPAGNGSGGPGYQFPNETDNGLTHDKGVVSMANAGPNTNGSQFFITVAPTKQLDGGYSIFGKVVKGQEIADAISKVPTNPGDKPKEAVVMESVTIVRKGKEAKDFDAPAVFAETRVKLQEKADKAMEGQRKANEERMKQEREMQEKRMKEQQGQVDEAIKGAKSTQSGLYYKVLKDGKGAKPKDGQKVQVHYAGYLMDGSLFDSSIKEIAQENNKYNPQREPYAPFEVTYGPGGRVIEGWKEGLTLMNVGDKFRFIIPPQLGYGARGAGAAIPPNSWLIFDVEMIGIK